jgi:hypothetical protein
MTAAQRGKHRARARTIYALSENAWMITRAACRSVDGIWINWYVSLPPFFIQYVLFALVEEGTLGIYYAILMANMCV